jgi:hypothetical protein
MGVKKIQQTLHYGCHQPPMEHQETQSYTINEIEHKCSFNYKGKCSYTTVNARYTEKTPKH